VIGVDPPGQMLSLDDLKAIVGAQRERGKSHVIVPIYRRVSADLVTPVSAFLALRDGADYAFLLESVEGGEKLARYSFLGRDPYRVIVGEGNRVVITDSDTGESVREGIGLFEAIRREMERFEEVRVAGLPRLTGGAVGYASYDTVRLLEDLPDPPPDDLNTPEGIWCLYDTVAAFDHVKHQIILVSGIFVSPDTDLDEAHRAGIARIEKLAASLTRKPRKPPDAVTLTGEMSSNFSREDFEAAVRTAKKHIFEGDIFQVVISQRFHLPFRGDRFNLYRALRQVNPSPYLFYLDFQEFALIGSSPEVLVRVEAGKAEVLPIAGTRPRGETPEEDDRLAKELLEDPKERAEHLMLVDLGRNDLGRVCAYGSVEVERYAYVERYSHVMHIVSSVSGTLSPENGAVEALAACFPAGTVSGAPKVRAMTIIDALEPTRRGPYAGTVGYLDFSGNLDSCITIRTMVVQDDAIFIQAGAGIVADSDPASEYEETLNKARALKQAIRLAAGELL
jgi:anthranilate synthase component I